MHRSWFALRPTLTTIILGGCAVIAPGALAQQFQDQTATRFPASPNEYSNQLTIGDIDGDGDLDIIFANGGGTSAGAANQVLRIYINNGTGVFTDESLLRTGGLAFKALGVELGDVDRDGDLDIIVANDFNNLPALLINDGTGHFTNQTATRLPLITLSASRGQFGDVDNDGDLDLFFCNGGTTSRFGTGPCKLYLNNGMGVFTDASGQLPAASINVAQPMDAIFGDIDGDLDLDIRVASRGSNGSKLYRNNGLGTFTNVSVPVADQTCYSYDFGDMDGDGDLDLLGVNAGSASAELLLKNGGTGNYTNASSQLTFNPSTDDNDSKFFDYDNDGDLDLLIGSLGSSERIYNNNGAGVFSNTSGLITAIADSTLDIKVGDLNGDGRLDIVTAQGESGAFVNRIYMNVTGPADTIPPNIVKTEQAANPPVGVTGPFVIRTIIYDGMTSDRGFFDKGIVLNYQMNSGPILTVNMDWDGNSLWRGVIPAQNVSGTLSYFVTARDFANNLATGAKKMVTISLPCPADVTGNHVVDIDDLVAVITSWGQTSQIIDIGVQDTQFTPNSVNAHSGDTLRFNWINGTHTATSGSPCTSDGKFDFPITSATPTASYVIPHSFSGSLPWFCTPHCGLGMTASATVTFSADVTGNGVVDIDDLVAVITAWGNCQ